MSAPLTENANRAGLNNIETIRSAAEDLTGLEMPIDACVSRLGLMLFASPKSALMAIRQVLKPQGRFAALVFTTPDKNPFFSGAMAILRQHAGKSPPPAGQPGLFALGGPGVLEDLLESAGFTEIEMTTVSAQFRLPSSDDALGFLQQAAGAYRAVVAELSNSARNEAWSEVREFLGTFESERGFGTELEFVIGSGAAPN